MEQAMRQMRLQTHTHTHVLGRLAHKSLWQGYQQDGTQKNMFSQENESTFP